MCDCNGKRKKPNIFYFDWLLMVKRLSLSGERERERETDRENALFSLTIGSTELFMASRSP